MAFRQGLAFPGEAPKHRIEQALLSGQAGMALGQGKGRADSSVGRRVEEDQLYRAQPQEVSQGQLARLQGALKAVVQQGVDFTQAPQKRCRQQAGKGSVPGRQALPGFVPLEGRVEELPLLEGAAEQV